MMKLIWRVMDAISAWWWKITGGGQTAEEIYNEQQANQPATMPKPAIEPEPKPVSLPDINPCEGDDMSVRALLCASGGLSGNIDTATYMNRTGTGTFFNAGRLSVDTTSGYGPSIMLSDPLGGYTYGYTPPADFDVSSLSSAGSINLATTYGAYNLRDVDAMPDGSNRCIVGVTPNYFYEHNWYGHIPSGASGISGVASGVTDFAAFALSADKSHLFIVDQIANLIKHFSMSSAGNPSTLGSLLNSKSCAAELGASFPRIVQMNASGTKMYVSKEGANTIYQYNLSTAFDLSTAAYAGKSLTIGGATDIYGFDFSTDYKYMILSVYDGTEVALFRYQMH